MKKSESKPQHINISYDWKDFEGGVNEFVGALIVLGGDAEYIGDYLIYNSSKLTDEQKENWINDHEHDTIGILDLVNTDIDDLDSFFELYFNELGYTIKEDPFYDGSDTYGFNIVKLWKN